MIKRLVKILQSEFKFSNLSLAKTAKTLGLLHEIFSLKTDPFFSLRQFQIEYSVLIQKSGIGYERVRFAFRYCFIIYVSEFVWAIFNLAWMWHVRIENELYKNKYMLSIRSNSHAGYQQYILVEPRWPTFLKQRVIPLPPPRDDSEMSYSTPKTLRIIRICSLPLLSKAVSSVLKMEVLNSVSLHGRNGWATPTGKEFWEM